VQLLFSCPTHIGWAPSDTSQCPDSSPSLTEFSISSFCTVVDVMNYSRLQVLRLDGNEIKRNAMPPDAPLCLRRATVIEI